MEDLNLEKKPVDPLDSKSISEEFIDESIDEDLAEDERPYQRNSIGSSQELVGLGGVLILVGIGRVIAPITILYSFMSMFSSTSLTEIMKLLLTSGSKAYNPALAKMIIAELTLMSIFFVWDIILLALFFGKKKQFPKMMIALLVTTLVSYIIDTLVAHYLVTSYGAMNSGFLAKIAGAVVSCAIWIPYFLTSIRVKATFTN